MLVDDRVDFHNLKAGHASVVGDDLHGQVGLAITGAAANRRADAGGILRIDPIHVERDVITGCATAGHAQRFFDHGAHAALVNIAHGVNLDTGLANVFLLAAIDVAYAHQHAVLRLDLGRETV